MNLEDDIHDLEQLHRLRNHAYRYRERGFKQLAESLKPDHKDRWADVDSEPDDLVYPSLLKTLGSCRFTLQFPEQRTQIESYANDKFQVLNESEENLKQFLLSSNKSGRGSDVVLFQAARVVRAALSAPTSKPVNGFFISFFSLMREIGDVQAPSWMMGSVRARKGAIPTAFVTGETCRALNAFARCLEATIRQAEALITLAQVSMLMSSTDRIPAKWAAADIRRQILSGFCAISYESPRSLIDFDPSQLKELVVDTKLEKATTPKELLDAVGGLVSKYALAIVDFCEECKSSMAFEEAVVSTWFEENNPKPKRKDFESKGDYYFATEAYKQDKLNFEFGLSRTSAIADAIGSGKDYANALQEWVETGVQSHLEKSLHHLAPLRETVHKLRRQMEPSKRYVESVLDSKLAINKAGRFDVPELIFAASTLASIDRRPNDDRYDKALEIAIKWIENGGLADCASYLDTDSKGYSLVLLGSEVIRSLSQLVAKVDFDVPASFYREILDYFESTTVFYTDGGDLVGWRHDRPRHPIRAYRWTSSLAIIALDRFARMLDKRINRRVQRHFATKTSDDLQDIPSLDQLAYPDFGLTCLAPKSLFESNRDARGESVAFFLQRARAHLSGIDKVPAYPDPCYSLILFGPPGTGKTTLVEALAKTGRVDLVEVTPSDILIEGEAWVERRAKIVFRALSFLTSSVIMLDEFDPVLRSRELDNQRNAFSFLTPGMLPKLKDLNKQASKRRVAFFLITNRIGQLDEAAIRTGRFDYKVGVYPPDLLSRAGRICKSIQQMEEQYDLNADEEKLLNGILDSAGLGMTLLAKNGNFVIPDSLDSISGQNTILGNSLGLSGNNFEPGPPDAIFKEDESSTGSIGQFEERQWRWVIEQDKLAKSLRDDKTQNPDERNGISIETIAELLE